MHLLTCPACEASIPVANGQAGERVNCPHCQELVDVPTLGRLRQLPVSEETLEKGAVEKNSAGGSVGFAILGLIATAALVGAGFCGVRWALIEVPITTEQHIAEYEEGYQELSAAKLIREFEQMDEFGIDLAPPYAYKQIENTKRGWGRSALVAGCISLVSMLGALLVGFATGKRK